jgi:tRNA G18 (ribose-2'-O)-methylase SpoU
MLSKEITSAHNPTYKLLTKLTKGRGIRKECLALICGRKQILEILSDFPDRCRGIIFSRQQALPAEFSAGRLPEYVLSPGLFKRIDIHGTGEPILLVEFKAFRPWKDKSGPSGCTLFIPFQDPVNVGAAIRSAAAFGVWRVVLLKEAAHPFHPKALRAAGSHVLRVNILQGPSLDRLRIDRNPAFTLSPEGKNIADFSFPKSFSLIPGLEGPGLPAHLRAAHSLAVPIEPGVESLNAATAVSIVLYVWRSREAVSGR